MFTKYGENVVKGFDVTVVLHSLNIDVCFVSVLLLAELYKKAKTAFIKLVTNELKCGGLFIF